MTSEKQTEPRVRQFTTGATRDLDQTKLDYEGFFSPIALFHFAQYMHKNRQTAAGVRDSDNWQRGIPLDSYIKSMFRHFMALWSIHRGLPADESLEDALGGLMFNVQGYMHETYKPEMAQEQEKEPVDEQQLEKEIVGKRPIDLPSGQTLWLPDGVKPEDITPEMLRCNHPGSSPNGTCIGCDAPWSFVNAHDELRREYAGTTKMAEKLRPTTAAIPAPSHPYARSKPRQETSS